ncbi:MAG: hypothetical protein LBQ66_10220 [Planctomycetaceae bacterium]|nr:hypothetical protein [Planctomycetaceae bacterium]
MFFCDDVFLSADKKIQPPRLPRNNCNSNHLNRQSGRTCRNALSNHVSGINLTRAKKQQLSAML